MPSVLSNIRTRALVEARRFVERLSGASAVSPAIGAVTKGVSGRSRRYNRNSDADIRDMMLAGTVYRPYYEGGALEDVVRSLGYNGPDAERYIIRNHYNATQPIVAFYRNAFGGRLGNDITIADEVNDRPVDPRMLKLLRHVWQWSNLDERADAMTTLCANQGRVGIRIVYEPGPPARVFLDFDDARSIVQVDRDARGNVVNVWLRYQVRVTVAGGTPVYQMAEEIIGKDGFSLTYDGQQQLTDEQRENPLGITPYVICDQDAFARHAYAGSEDAIHGINFGLSQIDESMISHVWPYLFATSSSAEPPEKFDVGRFFMMYAQSRQGFPEPTFQPLVPNIDFAAAIAQIAARVKLLCDRQPQLLMNSISLLSGTSGETLQQVLKAAEAESLRARTRYEDAVRRAIQIATSIGIATGMPGFDLGTGVGTAEAADRAYADGEGPEAFAFEDRPGLPPTVAQIQAQASANTADQSAKFDLAIKARKAGISAKGALRHAGLTEADIATNLEEIDDQDSLGVEEPDTEA